MSKLTAVPADAHRDAAALIVGFTIQGLAIARALQSLNIPVYAVERRRNTILGLRQIALKTRKVRIFISNRLSGRDLVETLRQVRANIPEKRVVLFAASDNTVSSLATYWDELCGLYELSWSDCRDEVLAIIHKRNLPGYCERAGVTYPKTAVIASQIDLSRIENQLTFPVLVKPDKPASSFKAHITRSKAELEEFAAKEGPNWPLVAQEWIDGPDTELYFYACLLDRGKNLFGMTGRKIRASPPGLGRATVIESFDDAGVHEVANRMIRDWPISGPVSLEFKKDQIGEYRFIEANVGRTEFCVDLLIQCGFNQPAMEFDLALGNRISSQKSRILQRAWYDTEKEPFAYISLCARQRRFWPNGKRPIFPYFGHGERRLVAWGLLADAWQFGQRLAQQAGEIWRSK